MHNYAVVYAPTFSPRPVHPLGCSHPPGSRLVIGFRMAEHGKGQAPACDGQVCMDCGLDATGRLDPLGGLERVWREHGWHRVIWPRVRELQEFWCSACVHDHTGLLGFIVVENQEV